jgi:Arm DNA-binding domain
MPKLKLNKTAADAARPETAPYELRDTIIPGLLLKVTSTGPKIFMLAYVANDGQRRKPAIGRFGEITVEQARGIAQDWLPVPSPVIGLIASAPAMLLSASR